MSELDQLRQEAEQLKSQIRVFFFISIIQNPNILQLFYLIFLINMYNELI